MSTSKVIIDHIPNQTRQQLSPLIPPDLTPIETAWTLHEKLRYAYESARIYLGLRLKFT